MFFKKSFVDKMTFVNHVEICSYHWDQKLRCFGIFVSGRVCVSRLVRCFGPTLEIIIALTAALWRFSVNSTKRNKVMSV